MMNNTNYKQYDSRWGSLGYPRSPWTIANSGCGEVAICNCIIEMAQYANETPATIQPYCVQYAAPNGDGTYWSGIPAMMKHYGMTEVMEHDTMPELFAELAKGNRVAVYLMGSRSAGSKGVHWTSGGHFVSSVLYKKEGGEDWVYMKDPNSTSDLKNGWISYNGNIRGACLKVWSGKLNGSPAPTPTPTPDDGHYTGEYPAPRRYLERGDVGTEVGKLQDYLNWYTDGKFYKECGGRDNVFGANTDKYVKQMQTDFFGASEADGTVGNKTIAKMRAYSKKDPKPTPTPTPTPTPSKKMPYTGQYPVVQRYLEPGDKGENVTRLQNYLNWYTDGEFFKKCGGADGVYGNNTLTYTKKMQSDFFGAAEADGLVGNKTIAKMKAYSDSFNPSPTPTPTPTPTKDTKVIDVSYVQTSVDWAKVKADGIQGAIIRCGFRHGEGGALDEDNMFMSHIKGASAVGLPVGIYFFTQAINAKEGKEEAEYAIKLWEKSGIPIWYPIGIDSEDVFWENPDGSTGKGRANSDKLSKAKRTEAIKAFAEECTRRGYKSMLYASTNWLYNEVDMNVLAPIINVWCAQWASRCAYTGKYIMWQYTSKGNINGIPKVVDLNHCYIEPKKVNPPSPQPTPTPTPDLKPYTGAYPTPEGILDASYKGIHNRMCTWCYDTYKSGKYHYVHFTDDEYTHQCPICTKRTYDLGWNCIGYATASLRHGGGVNCTCNCMTIYNGLGDRFINMSDAEVLSAVQNRFGIKALKIIRNNNRHIPESMLQKGDLLMYYTGDTYAHMAVYIGNGKISDDTSGAGVRYGVSYSMMKCLFAIRYTGARSYLEKGDEGKAVTDLQNYLNWYTKGEFFKKCGGADGIYGQNTLNYTIQLQKDFKMSDPDGTVGSKTIAKMKEYSDSLK